MVVATAAAVTIVATGGAAAVAGGALGATAGVSGGMAGAAGTIGAGTAVGASATAGLAGGAIAGTGAAVTGGAAGTAALTGTAVGAAAGTASGAGVSGMVAGIASGPIGWCVLGTSQSPDGSGVTYDCWKPVIHDTSEELSDGMLMKDVFSHPHVAKVTINTGLVPELPHIVLENIWNECFEIDYVMFVDTGKLACHARPVFVYSD